MKPVKDNLENATHTLNACRLNLDKLNRPEISQWQKVNLDAYGSMLESLELPTELKITQKDLAMVTSFARQITAQDNAIKELLAAIDHKSVNQVKAESESLRISKECAELNRQITNLQKSCAKFIAAEAIIRKKLTLQTLLPLARFSTSSQEKKFDEGLRLFFLVTTDREESSDQPGIHQYFIEANQIITTLNNLDTSGLPGPAKQMIAHYSEIAISAANDIKNLIDRHAHKFEQELDKIKKLKQTISSLKNEPLPSLLNHTHKQIRPLGEMIMDFAAKSQLAKDFNLAPPLIQDLNIFCQIIKHRLLEELRARIIRPDSPLNPAKISALMAAIYFHGPKGILRIIRLLLSSLLSGGRLISSNEIEEKMQELLVSCPIYYGNSEADLQTLKTFINSVLEGYNKPFPYNGLLRLSKKTLATYGSQIENYISTFPVEEQSSETSPLTKPDIFKGKNSTVASLTSQLKEKAENLRKIK
ncbi:MAG: hypothetical protein KKB30_03020 [Proteobacteria bacterium]|nr:hypothetical protein [Pseudomonadota bacterium]MBU1716073.1 hypothetical protein [Pseudomonadota bacterium]